MGEGGKKRGKEDGRKGRGKTMEKGAEREGGKERKRGDGGGRESWREVMRRKCAGEGEARRRG